MSKCEMCGKNEAQYKDRMDGVESCKKCLEDDYTMMCFDDFLDIYFVELTQKEGGKIER